ncbi:MAG: hypothetical protein AAF610_03475 [Pseudomonadota bacterium]
MPSGHVSCALLRVLMLLFGVVGTASCSSTSALVDIWPVRTDADTVSATDARLADGADGVLKLIAAKGEVASASVAFRAAGAPVTVRVQTGNAIAEKVGSEFSSLNVDAHYVKHWFQGEPGWQSHRLTKSRAVRLVPELLLKNPELVRVDRARRVNNVLVETDAGPRYRPTATGQTFTGPHILPQDFSVLPDASALQPIAVPPGMSQQVWLTFRIPREQAAGVYSGAIEIQTEDGRVSARLPYELEVLPFELDPPTLLYGMYYRGQLQPGAIGISSELKSAKQLAIELSDIADHGFAFATQFQGNFNPVSRARLAQLRSAQQSNAYRDIYDQMGFTREAVFLFGIGTAKAAASPKVTRRTVSEYQARGYDHVYFAGRDEAKGEALKAQREAWSTLRQLGARVIATNNRHDLLDNGMGDALDVAVLARDFDPAEARQLRAQGVRRVLSYSHPQTATEDPTEYRRNYGFGLVAADYDGALLYAYQHSFGSIWDDVDHTVFRDHNLTYPTTDGVIGTVAWEGVRQAINDARYMATLERLAAESSTGDSTLYRQVAELKTALRNDNNWQPDEVRGRIVSLIRRALGEQ